MDVEDVLCGNTRMDISHEGGEFSAILEDRLGIIPCAPKKPTVGITTRALEMFQVLHLRAPGLTKYGYLKGLCNLHKVPYSPGLSEQFTIAYVVYVSLLDATWKGVEKELNYDTPNWCLKNCCPACTYKLEGEACLIFQMLFTMDGNDSLKRMLRCSKLAEEVEDEEGNILRAGPSKERTDTRVPLGDYYLGREKVDKWTREVIANLLGDELDDDGDNPCAERWKNMVNELTACMWGIFDETGIFLALCRHGGELAKYPLAMVEALLNALGKGLGGGYNIGCKFKSTLWRSPLGALSRAKGYQSLFLATYMVGLGIEDLEGCERFFSKSNALASSTRYASVFHRKQDIVGFMSHTDRLETSANLSTFLCNNYYQSINILRTLPALRHWMKSNDIQSFSVFDTWIKEEYDFLSIRDKEPMVETLEMEYYQKLINFNAAEEILHKQWENSTPQDVAHQEADRWAALEHRDKNLEVVLHLERKLSIVRRWKAGDPEWERAAVLVGKRRYQRCIDELEKLVVSRLFELTNMNQSKSGYKMRKHMAVALESRSKAIKAALVQYNIAAAALPEPRPPLSWEEVIEYTFLADFDLLRDSNRVDPSQRPWALPAARLAMDNYFKICRAVEEIKRLNIEIRRVITHIRDEEAFLRQKEVETREIKPAISHQISIYREERTCFNALHMVCFRKLALSPGFMGTLIPGRRRRSSIEDEDAVLTPEEASRRGVEVPEDHEEDWKNNSEEDEDNGLYGDNDGVGDRKRRRKSPECWILSSIFPMMTKHYYYVFVVLVVGMVNKMYRKSVKVSMELMVGMQQWRH
ncbi:hypothetical protein B0H10DRAFT_2166594 [Mycena sp. CBHHK59/15]|nr:hypothetical protein B0H10DRAFT_2166594 [Mycena sp. CBHHK59/15]